MCVDVQVLDISANLAEQLPGCVLQLSGLQELHAGERGSAMMAWPGLAWSFDAPS